MLTEHRKASWLAVALIVAASTALAVVSTKTRNAPAGRAVSATKPRQLPTSPTTAPPRADFRARLSLQPEALRLARRVGQRLQAGRPGDSIAAGTLTIGTERQPVRVIRHQDGDGERLEIAVGGGPATLAWSAATGATNSNAPTAGEQRSLVERLALDAPDQFVLAQLRGASYYTVARRVRPAEAGSADNYAGPLWDVVRVAEPQADAPGRPQSVWRLYYINSATGLLDRVVSEEQGEKVVAEVSGWSNQGGELVPSHVVWTRGGTVVMEYSLAGFSYSAR